MGNPLIERVTVASTTSLTVAVAQPALVDRDLTGNVVRHADTVRAAGTRLVVFPELSLTGYVMGVEPLEVTALEVLDPLRQACADTGSAALVGAPVRDRDGRTYLSTLSITGSGVDLAYRKMCLGRDEIPHFAPGGEPAYVEIDGWRLGLGICKDTGNADQIAATAALGIDTYVAGMVNHADEVGVQDTRGSGIARRHGVFVLFSSYAGSTGGGYAETAGTSTVWGPTGEVLARTTTAPGEIARAELAPV